MSRFADWYEKKWRAEGETKTRALYRFCLEHGVSHRALNTALKGDPVRNCKAAEALAAATGGVITAAELSYPETSSADQAAPNEAA